MWSDGGSPMSPEATRSPAVFFASSTTCSVDGMKIPHNSALLHKMAENSPTGMTQFSMQPTYQPSSDALREPYTLS